MLFSDFGIEVIAGAQGAPDAVIKSFLAAELKTGENICDH
jgi:predicted Fe-Mo cluster-binding NifX family protein